MITQESFLAAYRAAVLAEYRWARDQETLDRYMVRVSDTIAGTRKTWNCGGAVVVAAWLAAGGKPPKKGTVHILTLRALPKTAAIPEER